MSDFRVELRSLRKSFVKGSRTIEVLGGIDLTLRAGDRISIMGRSGAGKSTLLHVLGGLERPTAGSVRIGDLELSAAGDRDAAALRSSEVGFVFQFHHLLPEFSALENVMMPAVIAGEDFDSAHRQASAMLSEVGLDHRLDHRPGELSGGEQQRVAIARALVHRPNLVLADEPTGNLDHRTGTDVFERLLEVVSQREAILVVVTHDLELADQMPRRLLLEDGELKTRK